MPLYISNMSFGDTHTGEVLDLDPNEWQVEIEAGMLSPVDSDGNRIVDLPTVWDDQFEVVAPPEYAEAPAADTAPE